MAVPSPAEGENPFLFYRDVLHEASFIIPENRGAFRARLITLFCILGVLLVASVVNLGLHLWGARLNRRKVWVWRIVEREGGKHIVSNHLFLCGPVGIALFVVLCGDAAMCWRVWLTGDSYAFQQLARWSFSVWPVAFLSGWLLSWASFQAWVQVGGSAKVLLSPGRSRRTCFASIPPLVENILFVGGGVAAVAILGTLAGVASRASDLQWSTFHDIDDRLSAAAAAWDGSGLTNEEALELITQLQEWKRVAGNFYHTASDMCIGAAVLPVFLCLINCLLLSFWLLIRRQIHFQLNHLPTVPGTVSLVASPFPAHGNPPVSPTPLHLSTDQSVPKQGGDNSLLPVSNVFDQLPTFVPLNNLGASLPIGSSRPSTASPVGLTSPRLNFLSFSPGGPSQPSAAGSGANEPRTPRRKPTRADVREMAADVEGAVKGGSAVESQVAERIMALVKAEQELLLIGLTVFTLALFFAICCSWAASTLHDYCNLTWKRTEAFVTGPIWLAGVGAAVAEIGHGYIEWRDGLKHWIPRERLERARRGSIDPVTTIGGGGGGAVGGAKTPKKVSSLFFGWRSSDASGAGAGTTAQSNGVRSRGLGLGLATPLTTTTGAAGGGIEVAVVVEQREEVDVLSEGGDSSDARRKSSGDSITSVKRKEAWEK
ncbi:hypothetical protein JCM8547_001957 [Rhodosporidiobolus lusitaniae]